MSTAQVAIVCSTIALPLLIAAAIAAVLAVSRRRGPAIDSYLGHRIVVHVRGGSSVRGVLAGAHPDVFVLRQAHHLTADGAAVPLDGEQVVSRSQLDYFQVLPAEAATS